MAKKKTRSTGKTMPAVTITLLALAGLAYYLLFSSMTGADETRHVYIDDDDTADSVYTKLQAVASPHGLAAFKALSSVSGYPGNIRPGRYELKSGEGTFGIFRKMRNGMQAPVSLTIPTARTIDKLAAALSQKLMLDSADIHNALADSATCETYGYNRQTIPCLFIPNTYDIYWNISIEGLLRRMKKESDRFWTAERMQKAQAMDMTPEEVMTMASIIDEETANDPEKPMIAGMYLNRLKAGMPLQADPTIKFALGDFSIRRIYNNMLSVKSPYNTYKNTGLPPGPIRIPSVAGIDAVLNHTQHDYLYMCAKEDFSGTHNFARTYDEHLKNAERYTKALNERNIK